LLKKPGLTKKQECIFMASTDKSGMANIHQTTSFEIVEFCQGFGQLAGEEFGVS
jgi:hypothetical protein